MTTRASQRIREADSALRNDNYQSAELLLRQVDASAISQVEYAHYCVLWGEVSMYTGKVSVDNLDRAIEILRYGDETGLFARAKFLKGWLLSEQGVYAEAKQHLLEAHANFLRCENLRGSARSLNRLAYVMLQTGNLASAIETLKDCSDIYRRMNDRASEALVLLNLCCLYTNAGLLGDALVTYGSIGDRVLELGDRNATILLTMSAIPRALKGDVDAARDTIAKAKGYLNGCVREKAIYFENLGLLCLLAEDYDGAERALKDGLRISLEIAPESALVSQVKRLMGDLYLAQDRLALAKKYATEALAVAEQIGEKVEVAACWRIFAQVEQRRRDMLKAREWFRKAIDLFNRIGTRYELAVTRYLAGSSAFFDTGERMALLHLAREYFESERVAPFLDKVEVALRALLPLRRSSRNHAHPPTIIATGSTMKRLLSLAENVAQSEMAVLLTGDTGTGKDLMARHIHYHSRRQGQFVSVNAAAIPDHLIEAELFGHSRGAFTGAERERLGLFRLAHNGTLYLNEIADTTPEFQAKLLEVLETREVRRLGEDISEVVAFRLIAATNQDPLLGIKQNRFRADLYHRLNEIHIHLPPLEERREDIAPLVRFFLGRAGLDLTVRDADDERALERLCRLLEVRSWPGNVRELEHEIPKLWVASRGDLTGMLVAAAQRGQTCEQDRIVHVLESTGWNRRETARLLGMSEATVRRRISRYGLHQPD